MHGCWALSFKELLAFEKKGVERKLEDAFRADISKNLHLHVILMRKRFLIILINFCMLLYD